MSTHPTRRSVLVAGALGAAALPAAAAWGASGASARPTTASGASAAPDDPAYDILVFSKTAGFRHDSIPDGIAALQ
ncbi:glycosyl hydrolase, partial [Streptomyces sp. 6N223]